MPNLWQYCFATFLVRIVNGAEPPVVSTMNGRIQGSTKDVLGKTVEVYLGIPFARPPVGSLRFREPHPADPWNGTYNATAPKTCCTQKIFSSDFAPYVPQSEDCLFLNVWTPTRSKPLKTVLVWIHGGGFTFGSAYQHWYDGSVLAALHDVVVVTLNYRLNIFGFLNAAVPEATGNMGLMDQNLALQWVRENILGFGGNPASVTLFGESAGSFSASAHLVSPLSRGLFKRAVLMSGVYGGDGFIDSFYDSLTKGNTVAQLVGCASSYKDLASYPAEVLDCLRLKPAEELCEASYKGSATKVFNFIPSHPNTFLPKRPTAAVKKGEFSDVDVMMGIAATEGNFAAISFPDKRIQTEDLEGITEAELKQVLRAMALAWLPDKFAPTLEHYTSRATPGDKRLLRELHTEFVSDGQFVCSSKFFAEEYSGMGNKVYFSVFGHRSVKFPFPKWTGIPHTSDIPYYFGVPFLAPEHFTDEDRDFSTTVMTAFTEFARTGQVF
ncbi:hypothetical protein HPB48_011388 [Haemaphysalis longicornis]|uniref:Carboxylic ester hydrolase n=1 Tax=Haemaphysalis longicornis TaxID=44386 RepID=A0A9J6GGI9_HAELO|nr:hypothetical protein HPB48_011388 [Haemaphysalis longicornis]